MSDGIGWETPLPLAVGGPTATRLAGLGLRTVGDLLEHSPRRYVDNTVLTDLAALDIGEHVTLVGEVRSAQARSYQARGGGRGGRRQGSLLSVVIRDDSGAALDITFFNQAWRERELVVGTRALFMGTIGEFRGRRQLTHPDYQIIDGPVPTPRSSSKSRLLQERVIQAAASGETLTESEIVARFLRRLIPVYRLSKDVYTWHITDSVAQVLAVVELDDPLPADVRARYGLPDRLEAYRMRHLPETMGEVSRSRRRFAWDEALVLQVELARRRRRALAFETVPRPGLVGSGLAGELESRLPYRLTDGQRAVLSDIRTDLAVPRPMLRLLQGEVGSGKTVVALLAMLTVVDSGGQAALLAPTEVLASQHARSIRDLLGELALSGMLGGAAEGTRVALLSGSLSASARRQSLLDAASGEAGIVIGTHALLQDRVQFADLGLVVVDEQHRFGVEQRDALRMKNDSPPHVLVMTATPIPRTVAMTVFGDLETSTLRERPAARAEVTTVVVPAAEKPTWYDRAWVRVREEVSKGHQAYVVCPRIGDEPERGVPADTPEDDGEAQPTAAVLDIFDTLANGPLDGLRVGVLHGRLAADVKDATMRQFAAGEIDVLVATTVIEVGVDVPNASAMVVLDADRFGASQLHQLRGRIGRGSLPGVCLLVTRQPSDAAAMERLRGVAATTDGFEVARLDLEQRREGDVLGAVQSGRSKHVRVLSLLRDEDLIAEARTEAIALVGADPELAAHPVLARAVADVLGTDRGAYLEKA